MRSALAVAVALAALGPRAAVRGEPAAPVHLVTIDVIPADAGGRVLDDLKAADFELREEGTVQRLEGARFVHDDARLLAIFLDEYHVSPGESTERARAALTRFVDRNVSPRDLVVVLKPLDSLLQIRATADLAAVRRSIDSFEGRKGDYQPRNDYERDFFAATPPRIDAARDQVALSAINALAVHLGSVTDRRKTLLVVSEGMGRTERRRGVEFLATFGTIHRSADRANVSLYTVDPRETTAADAGDDSLRTIAGETDGQAIAGDLDAGLGRVAADSTAYYMLTYRSARPEDGKFHGVQVSVKRAGASVRARNGYWAPSPDEVMRAAMLAAMNEPKPVVPLEPAPHVSPMIRPWFGESRGVDGKTRVTFVWEPAARVPGDRTRQLTPARLVLTARTPDGTVLFEGPVSPTGPATVDEPGVTPARAVFDTPPGRVRLRMSIEDVSEKELDQDVRDVSVRDLRGAVAIGTPEILRARNAREFRALDSDAAVPVASREFSRAERLLIHFRAYGPAGAPPPLSATLMGRAGSAMRPLVIVPAAAPGGENAIELPLAGLATGEYIIELKAGEIKDRLTFRVTP